MVRRIIFHLFLKKEKKERLTLGRTRQQMITVTQPQRIPMSVVRYNLGIFLCLFVCPVHHQNALRVDGPLAGLAYLSEDYRRSEVRG